MASLRALALALLGASLTASLAPFGAWWWAPWPLAALLYLAARSPVSARRDVSAFYIGYFASGSSWIYVSMHNYGHLPVWLAAVFTAIFAIAMGSICALPFYWRRLWLGSSARLIIGFTVVWVASEWLRLWLLTGFPWLYLGYSQTETWLGAWAPVLGVLGVSAIVALLAALVAWLALKPSALRLCTSLGSALALIGSSWLLTQVHWTQADPEASQSVSLVQGNVEQNLKWEASERERIRRLYLSLSEPLWQQGALIIWPEAAIPEVFNGQHPVFDYARERAASSGSGLISGVPSIALRADGDPVLHNSVFGLGSARGIYHKQRLVPFGEYVPLADAIGPVFDLLRVPMSDFRRGPNQQANLHTGRFELAADICYEVAYPVLIAKQARTSGALLTISNDTWFGHSIGPHQHLQIAQMRARENQRPMIRATNNGITAFITPDGRISRRAPQFEQAVLTQTVTPHHGTTPYQRWYHWPLLLLMLGSGWYFRRPPRQEPMRAC